MPQPYVVHTIKDFSGETAPVKHYLNTITNANYAVVTGNVTPGVQHVATLRAALGAITEGEFVKHSVTSHTQRLNTQTVLSLPAAAQREKKILVLLRDNVNGLRFSFEIAAPDSTLLALPGTDNVNTSIEEWTDFKDWLELRGASPWGNAITVLGGRIVGRNL